MDGQDEWRYFTDKDMEDQRNWERKVNTWDEGFVKSRRKKVWVFHATHKDSNYAPEIQLFDTKAAAEEYVKQFNESDIFNGFNKASIWSSIDFLPINTKHEVIQ